MRRIALALVVLAVAGTGTAQARAAASPTKGVVLVTTNLALENGSAAGTGMVLTPNGEVLTNNHVIRGATTIKVTVPTTHKTYTARVLGYDIADDVALLKLNGAAKLATIARGNSGKVSIGQTTRAVGNANGGGRLVITTGRVTALNQSIQIRDDTGEIAQLKNLIQTSARLVPGDSGGPLLDAAGRVIGIDAAGSAAFASQTNAPGYAIPINLAYGLVKQIEAGRSSASVHIGATAFIGLQVSATTANGVSVGSVVPGSPAEQAGLQQGDLVTAVDGNPVVSFTDLRTLLFTHHPGDSITLAFSNVAGNPTQVTIVLADGPPQ